MKTEAIVACIDKLESAYQAIACNPSDTVLCCVKARTELADIFRMLDDKHGYQCAVEWRKKFKQAEARIKQLEAERESLVKEHVAEEQALEDQLADYRKGAEVEASLGDEARQELREALAINMPSLAECIRQVAEATKSTEQFMGEIVFDTGEIKARTEEEGTMALTPESAAALLEPAITATSIRPVRCEACGIVSIDLKLVSDSTDSGELDWLCSKCRSDKPVGPDMQEARNSCRVETQSGPTVQSDESVVPICNNCENPATCYDDIHGYSCGDCCGHWDDGETHCHTVVEAAAMLEPAITALQAGSTVIQHPTAQEKSSGLYGRYQVFHADGTRCDENAKYFVLRLDDHPGCDPIHTAACRAALDCYAHDIRKHLPAFAEDLWNLLKSCEPIAKTDDPAAVCNEQERLTDYERVKIDKWLRDCGITGWVVDRLTGKVHTDADTTWPGIRAFAESHGYGQAEPPAVEQPDNALCKYCREMIPTSEPHTCANFTAVEKLRAWCEIREQRQTIQDLTVLVERLCRQLPAEQPVRRQALYYLARKRESGEIAKPSVLRDEKP